MTTTTTAVQGHCPLGHDKGLQLLDDGRIMCRDPWCEHPYGVTELLSAPPAEHMVQFGGKRFWVAQHPLRESLDGDLFACTLGDFLSQLHGDPMPPGKYRAVLVADAWTFGIPVTPGSPPLPDPEPACDELLPDPAPEPVTDPDCHTARPADEAELTEGRNP